MSYKTRKKKNLQPEAPARVSYNHCFKEKILTSGQRANRMANTPSHNYVSGLLSYRTKKYRNPTQQQKELKRNYATLGANNNLLFLFKRDFKLECCWKNACSERLIDKKFKGLYGNWVKGNKVPVSLARKSGHRTPRVRPGTRCYQGDCSTAELCARRRDDDWSSTYAGSTHRTCLWRPCRGRHRLHFNHT